jgi:myb proto-oncogene protein
METLNDMGSLSVDPSHRMPLNICFSVCFDMGQRGFALEGKSCSNRLENNQCSEEVGDGGKEQKHKAARIENIEESLVNGKDIMEGREPKICNRGHWRPAEDSKLKELVALYGPQNWNLIAEKLRGRSGNKRGCKSTLSFFFGWFLIALIIVHVLFYLSSLLSLKVRAVD